MGLYKQGKHVMTDRHIYRKNKLADIIYERESQVSAEKS